MAASRLTVLRRALAGGGLIAKIDAERIILQLTQSFENSDRLETSGIDFITQ